MTDAVSTDVLHYIRVPPSYVLDNCVTYVGMSTHTYLKGPRYGRLAICTNVSTLGSPGIPYVTL